MLVHAHAHTHKHMYTHKHMHSHTRTHARTHAHTHTHSRTHTHTHIRMHTRTHTHAHTHTHTRTHAHASKHVHVTIFVLIGRSGFGRSTFLRVEIINKDATSYVIFGEAVNSPLPFRLENFSQVRECTVKIIQKCTHTICVLYTYNI